MLICKIHINGFVVHFLLPPDNLFIFLSNCYVMCDFLECKTKILITCTKHAIKR